MPQIAQIAETYSSQIFWLLLTFGFVFFVVGRGMVPKIQATVDARDSKIADDLAFAKASFAKADELEEDWRAKENASRTDAQAVIAEAKAQATLATEGQLHEADAAIAVKIAAAEASVEAARSGALTQIEAVAADAAAEMVLRVAGTQVSPQAATEAAKAALANG
ncbi:MAG TPA: ATPase [Sphingobium sp.]|uniref:F0F1 ATP synthase subunit B family protein n=1 Tax=Sphingobium sp. TaxID=1912891 RepID=UPI002ED3A8C9